MSNTCDTWNAIYHNWLSKAYGLSKSNQVSNFNRLLLKLEIHKLNINKCLNI